MSLESFVSATLRRPVTVLMLAAATLLVGLITYLLIPVELLPRGFTEEDVTVFIPIPAGNPTEVQEQVIRPAEEQIRTIPGIKEVNSRARADSARIRVGFSREVDLDLSVAELRDRLERARVAWPEEVREYFIWRFNLDTDIPILSFAIDLERENDQVTFLVEEKVLKPLEALPGVARVTVWGLLDDQIRVYVDRNRALAQGVSIYQLTQTLAQSNIEVSAGEIEDGEIRYAVRTDARFRDLQEIRDFPINARGLRLGQIARVEPAKSVREFVALSRNRRSLWCQVYKESAANTVATADRVRSTLVEKIGPDPRLAELGATVRLYRLADIGQIITDALGTLRRSASLGAVLALLVLFYFMRRLSLTLIITTGIPLSLLLTLTCLYFGGGSLNLLSMLGLTVAIGMLVDNSIVVVENISRHREAGLGPLPAARRGASEVALAITLSTLTTLAAFLPIIFMGGDAQLTFFTSGIGLPLCVAVLASLLVAIVFIPLATVTLHRPKARSRLGTPGRGLLHQAREAYAKVLGYTLGHRFHTVLLVGTSVAILTAVAWNTLPKVDILSEAGGRLSLEVDLGSNFTLDDAYEVMTEYGRFLDARADEYDIEHFWCFFRRSGGNFMVDLTHQDMARTREIAERLKKDLPPRAGVELSLGVDDQSSGERGKLTLDIFGPDPQVLLSVSHEVCDHLSGLPGILSVRSDLEEAEEEVHVLPDRERAALLGIDPRTLRGTLEYGIRGWRFSDLVMGEREIPLIIGFEGSEERDLPELRSFPIASRSGRQVPLSSVAGIEVTRGFGEIRRSNGRARAHLTIETSDQTQATARTRLREALARYPLPPGYTFTETQRSEMEVAMAEMTSAVALAVTFVFLLMGILFESFILPLAVLVTIPFSWAGATWGLALTGTPLDFVGAIGVLVLVGIVVNNGIVLIDCAHRIRASGVPRTQALVEAGRIRMRPILMTAATTIVGLIPMAIAESSGSQISYKALSRAVMGGLIVATISTLFFVPILYSVFDDLRRLVGRTLRGRLPALRPGTDAQTPAA